LTVAAQCLRGLLSGIFRYASRHLGFPGQSPTASLDRVERPNLDDQRDKRILSQDELNRLLAAIPERLRLLYELASETGGRRGEILGLNWSEIDFDAGTIEFTHQLSSRTRQRVPLKTKRSRRAVEITPAMAQSLRAAKLKSRRSGDHDLVFPGQDGNGRDGGVVARTLDRAAKRAGLDAILNGDQVVLPAPTFHSLRHTHASALIAAGWDLEEVSARLGHTDVSVTAKAYVRAYDHARRSVDRRTRLQALYSSAHAPINADVRSING
jgi:integrase